MKLKAEFISLTNFLDNIIQEKQAIYPDPRDLAIFNTTIPILIRLINTPISVKEFNTSILREKIRWLINQVVFSLYLHSAPRYFLDADGNTVFDIASTAWTSNYFRIEPVLTYLRKIVKGKTILDPMAGSGSDMHLIAAFCQPKRVICTDICYLGGKKVPGTEMYYYPSKNRLEIERLFTGLPDYYQPHLLKIIQKYEYQNAKNLPFTNKEFDWIITDPPFGINFKPGGFKYFQKILPELLRVASQGIIFSSLLSWEKYLKKKGFQIINLTGDATKGKSKYPSCYILIKK